MRWAKDVRAHLQSMQRDVASLSDHATYLANKITFLLDAMLGVVNIEQNNIIKIFSIAAVMFMPPTLVASIYGMNFHTGMVELEWEFGYPFALVLMVFAAVLPYCLSSMEEEGCLYSIFRCGAGSGGRLRGVGDAARFPQSAVQAASSRRASRASLGPMMARPATGHRSAALDLGLKRWIGSLTIRKERRVA